jgi:hypothetical protein
MVLSYQDRTMTFNHEQDLMRTLRFMFGQEVALAQLRKNEQDSFRSVFLQGQGVVAVVYFYAG